VGPAGLPQEPPQQVHQTRVVEQPDPDPPALGVDLDVLVAWDEVEVLDVNPECLADPAAGRDQELEQQPVADPAAGMSQGRNQRLQL
jgi:hypothetical protein